MIEIVFNESAADSLKIGQSYGKGKYRDGVISVFIKKIDGSDPTEEEKEAALQEAKEKDRLAWESAIPIGGNPGDVFCFALALSMGMFRKINRERRGNRCCLLSIAFIRKSMLKKLFLELWMQLRKIWKQLGNAA